MVAGGRPYRAILANLPTALARFDALVAAHQRPALARTASQKCSHDLPTSVSSGYRGTDGTSVSNDVDGASGSGTLGISTSGGNGVTISVQFKADLCDEFDAPKCPTADGKLDGTDSNPLEVRTTITKGAQTLRRESIETTETEKLAGQVADDAEFDSLELTDASRFRFSVGGSQVAHAVTIFGQILRTVRVNMRTGSYDSSPGGVTIGATVDGIFLNDAELVNLASKTEADSNQEFAKIAQKEITRYHARETAFGAPNTCAQLTFSPASNTLKLAQSAHGTFNGSINASDGGQASKARWSMTGQQNASFSPTSAPQPSPTFTYDVTRVGPGVSVQASFHVTSTAGVAELPWTQPTKDNTINTIAGTFSGSQDAQGSVLGFTGNVTYTRADQGSGVSGSFEPSSGEITYTASGSNPAGPGCRQSGTQQFPVSPSVSFISTSGTSPSNGPPVSYHATAGPQPPASMPVTLTGCNNSSQDGQTMIGIGIGLDTGIQTSPDGMKYVGSTSQSSSGVTTTQTWNLVGAP